MKEDGATLSTFDDLLKVKVKWEEQKKTPNSHCSQSMSLESESEMRGK